MIKDERIAAVLESSADLAEAVSRLVREANDAGGRDNITVVAFRLEGAEDVAADEGATLVGPSAEDAGLEAERIRAAAERRAPAAEPPPRGRRLRTAAKVLAALLIVAGLGVAAVFGARQVYFLGIDEGGRVALYRGLPYELPLDVDLYSEVYSAPFQADAVPEERRDEITDHTLRGRDDAESLIESLEGDLVTPLPGPPASAGASDGQQPAGGGQQPGDGDGDGGGAKQRGGDGGRAGDRQRQGAGDQNR